MSLFRYARAYPLFSFFFLVASVCVVWPLWSAAYLPLVDWPQHLGMVSYLRHATDPQWGFGLYADWHNSLTYLTFYYLSASLAFLFPVEVAARISLSLYAVATPLAAMYMLRSFRLPSWGALLAFPIVYNWCFYMGFIPFILSLPLVLIGVGLMRRHTMGVTRLNFWQLVGLTLFLFVSHPFAYLMFGAVAVLLLCFFPPRRLRSFFLTCLAFVPSMVLFGIWVVVFSTRPKMHHLMASMTVQANSGLKGLLRANYMPWKDKVNGLTTYFNEAFHGHADRTIFWCWLGCLLFLLGCGLVGRRSGKEWLLWLRRIGLVICSFGLYFAMPMGLLGVWAISPRFVPLYSLLALLLIPELSRKNWVNALIFTPVLVMGLSVGYINTQKFQAFEKETKGFHQAIQALPYGKRVYGLMYDQHSSTMSQPVFLHFPAYALLHRGGVIGFSHFHYSEMPAKLKTAALAPYPGQSGEWYPGRWKYDLYGDFYDYLLVRGGYFYGSANAPRTHVKSVHSRHRWHVYHNPKASRYWPLFSFREKIERAQVFLVGPTDTRTCPLKKGPRFLCPHAGWSEVKPYQTNLNYTHIPCIWAHPVRGKTLLIRFDAMPAQGDRISGIFGIADSARSAHSQYGPPVELEIRVDGRKVWKQVTSTRQAYTTYDVALPTSRFRRSIEFRIRAKHDGQRHFCFTGTLFKRRRTPSSNAPKAPSASKASQVSSRTKM